MKGETMNPLYSDLSRSLVNGDPTKVLDVLEKLGIPEGKKGYILYELTKTVPDWEQKVESHLKT
jgi:hypothetical protein